MPRAEAINDARWAELLCSASSSIPSFLALKHLDGALNGMGDFDCAVEKEAVEVTTSWFRSELSSWSDVSGIITCDHVPDARLILVLSERTFPFVQEIDLAWSL